MILQSSPPPRAVANDVSEPKPLVFTCPPPNSASANGRNFRTETDTRGPKRKFSSWEITFEQKPCSGPEPAGCTGKTQLEALPKCSLTSATMPTQSMILP